MFNFLRLLRVKQWVKNGFIFFPLIFSGKLGHHETIEEVCLTFIGFCLLASSLYVLNDFLDIASDRHHPIKSQRPLVKIRKNPYLITTLVLSLMLIGLMLCSTVGPNLFFIGGMYVLLHVVYNYYAKKIVILDVIFVAMGFEFRIWAGSLAAHVYPSVWLQMCVLLLALFLGFIKRRHELIMLKEKASDHRKVLEHYTVYLLDQMIMISATLTIVFYSLYAMSNEVVVRLKGYGMVYSIPFILYGIFRYFYLVHVKKLGGDPGEIMFSDKSLLIVICCWLMYILYLYH